MPFDIQLSGAPALLALLDQYPAIRDEEYEQAARDALEFLRSPLREYPPARSGSTYVRTMTLQGGWENAVPTFAPRGDGFDARLENPTVYGPYVQGGADDDPHQAAVHQGYWNTDDAIVDDNRAEIEQFFSDANERIVKRLGG